MKASRTQHHGFRGALILALVALAWSPSPALAGSPGETAASPTPERPGRVAPVTAGSPVDSDGDGIPDDDGDATPDPCTGGATVDCDDNCPLTSNSDQAESDGDGYGDVCDNCIFGYNPDQTDTDVDTLGDACDNCALVGNLDQSDSEGDGIGDVCDNCIGASNSDQTDSDSDTLGDACDNCPWVAPADQTDSEGDGVGDLCDNCTSITNPDQNDIDKDGLGDACSPICVDFTTPESEVAEGCVADVGVAFDPGSGLGWNSPVPTRERSSKDPLERRTFAFTSTERRFTLELPNADYDVHAVSGDPSYAQGPHRVRTGEVALVPEEGTAAGTFVEDTVRVAVRNGRLDVTVGGASGKSMLNLLEVTAVEQPSFIRSIDFLGEDSDPQHGFEPDWGYPYDDEAGYGWYEKDWISSDESYASVPQLLDNYVYSAEATWELLVPEEGYYDVWLAVGSASYPSGPHRVVLEGVPVVIDEPTAAGQFIERRVGAFVEDGYLTVEIGTGQKGQWTAINYIVVAAASDDADDDGYDNDEDLCPFSAESTEEDADEDGVGDACDPDRDGDGVENTHDVCPDLDDPFQEDSDGDRTGDGCESCPADPFNDLDGDGVCALSDNCPDLANPAQDDEDSDGFGDACDLLRINFGPPGSEPAEGFRSSDGSRFSAFLRLGWNTAVATRERFSAFDQELDTFAFSGGERRFSAEWPNGDYLVHVSVGDASFSQGPHRVLAQGASVFEEPPVTAAGAFEEGSVGVQIRTGRLELTIGEDVLELAPAPWLTTLNYVEAIPAETQPSIVSVNFQSADATPALGFEPDSGAPYDEKLGRGWSGPVHARERNRSVPQALDTFVFTEAARTWEIALPPGSYSVWTSVGDPTYAQGPQRLLVEGTTVVNDEFTQAGEFLERSTEVLVEDGRLSIEIGGGGGHTCLNYVVVEPIPD